MTANWKPNKIPRPVWGIILEFSGPVLRSKLERVCKMLYLLINPICKCTDTTVDMNCKSQWRDFVSIDRQDANCSYIKRLVLRENIVSVLSGNLKIVKSLSCKQNLHDWEVNPSNKNMIRCVSCTGWAKRLEYCPGYCPVHLKICLNEFNKFLVCRAHTCIACRIPEISRPVIIINLILQECKNYTLHPAIKLVYKTELV
jgi:hypothetical protein